MWNGADMLHGAQMLFGDSPVVLIPGLPNDLACLCLAFVPFSHHDRLKTICKAWHAAYSSRFILDIRSTWQKTEEYLCIFRGDPSLTCGEFFDPKTRLWSLIPPMPCDPSTYGLSNFACVATGNRLLVIGGSVFDARSFPLDSPHASSAVYQYDPCGARWERLSNMRVPRGSFACGVSGDSIIVAGGGSRHVQFPAGGSRLSVVEQYEIKSDRWHFIEGLRRIRAGCAGFLYEGEFWVMGGYGRPTTISGILPADEYYRDGEILDLKTGHWRYLQPMWEEGERSRLGRVAVLDRGGQAEKGIFMLDGSVIFRYNVSANRWTYEARVPRKVHPNASCRLVALDGKLFVLSAANPGKQDSILFQVYDPSKRTWSFVFTKPRLKHSFTPGAVMCTIRF